MNTPTNPDFPAGPFECRESFDEALKQQLISATRTAPVDLQHAVDNLSEDQLNTRYRNWSIRQIVHHLADSHVHSYIRYKWAMTEDNPTIKAYNEADWVRLVDAREGDIGPSLALLHGLHAKWAQLLESMSEDQYQLTFYHPDLQETVDLWTALNYYPWHARHHTGQILWLKEQHDW